MARKVTFSVVPRKNLNDREAPPRYYARAQASGDVNVREMSERIQQSCTVTKADVHAVLVALEDVIIDALRSGEIVRLGDLGTFQIGLKSGSAETEAEYDLSLIKRAHINFRPGLALAGMLTTLSYAKVAKKTTKVSVGNENNNEELFA